MEFTKYKTQVENDATMNKIAAKVKEAISDLNYDEADAVVIAALLLRFSLTLYRGVLAKEEIEELLQWSAQNLESITPNFPKNRTLN
ncbi:hypothetical protein N8072_00790 [bacterium]|nr:hypothetical protein [bacterium]MDC1257196.1 hypothetical protein [bacterium]